MAPGVYTLRNGRTFRGVGELRYGEPQYNRLQYIPTLIISNWRMWNSVTIWVAR